MASGLNECLDYIQKINSELKKQRKLHKPSLVQIGLKEELLLKEMGATRIPSLVSYWDRIRYNYIGKFDFKIEKKCAVQILTDIFPYSKQNLQVS